VKTSQNDSFDLFADILTITLGVTMLFALFTALSSATSHFFPAELNDPEIQSMLLRDQVITANENVSRQAAANEEIATRIALTQGGDPQTVLTQARGDLAAQTIKEAAKILGKPDKAIPNLSPTKAALLRENQRLNLDILRLETAEDVISKRIESLNATITRASKGIEEANAAALRFLREDQKRPRGRPFYLVCQYDALYPLFQVTDGVIYRNQANVGWAHRRETDRLLASPSRGDGLLYLEALEYARSLSQVLEEIPDRYPVLLIYGDSFELGRDVLQTLIQTDIEFSWRPLGPDAQLVFSADGMPPPPPL
jgi:hypothetical protein